jgi:hypothetical protein
LPHCCSLFCLCRLWFREVTVRNLTTTLYATPYRVSQLCSHSKSFWPRKTDSLNDFRQFNDAVSTKVVKHRTIWGNEQYVRILMKADVTFLAILSRHSTGQTGKIHEKSEKKIADNSVKIRKGCLQNKRLERCRYTTNSDIKMAVFWVVAPCSLVEVYHRFRGPCCLNHQGDETHRPDD